MDMKLRGMYIARQLSFHGVTFKIEEVPLSKEFEKVYDESVLLVSLTRLGDALNTHHIVSHSEHAPTNRFPVLFFSGWKRCKSSPKPPN